MNLLFCGNSHTVVNDIPLMVKSLVDSVGGNRTVSTTTIGATFLEELGTSQQLARTLKALKWDFVVLQGLKLSSSHKFEYDHSGAVTVARKVRAAGAKPVFFCEWPRRNWDEAEWIVSQYRPIAKAGEAMMIEVSRAWPIALKAEPKLNLWAPDGNHASLAGSYMGAAALYYGLFGGKLEPTWGPKKMSQDQAQRLRSYARSAILGNGGYKNKGK